MSYLVWERLTLKFLMILVLFLKIYQRSLDIDVKAFDISYINGLYTRPLQDTYILKYVVVLVIKVKIAYISNYIV